MRRFSLFAGALMLTGLVALAVPLDEARGQIIESPKISYITPPPSVFISSSHPVVVKAEGLYGAVDCGPMGDWCQYYDYPFYLNSFAVKVNTVSQTGSFTPMDESYQGESCHWNQGDYGTDWYCWRIYQMSGNVALTLDVQNTVRAEVQYDGNPTTVTIHKTVIAEPDTNYAVGVEVNPTTWSGSTARLYVKNTGDYPSLYNLSATCTGTWITGCESYPDTVTVGAGQQTLIPVPVERWSPRGTGADVILRAELASDTTVWAVDTTGTSLPVVSSTPPAPAPELFVSPRAGMFITVDTVTLTINVCADEEHEDNPAWRVISVNGVNRVNEFSVSSSPGGEEHPGCDMWHTLEGLLELPTGETDVYVDFITEYGITATGEQTASFMRPPATRGVRVTTGLGARGLPVSMSGTRSFTVRNEGDTTAVYLLTPTCTGFASGGSCTAASSRVTLAPDSSATVDVSFTTSATPGTGGIMLVALDSLVAAVRDSSWAEIAPRAATVPAVDIISANAGATASRSQCLAFGIVPGVATECGVLRFTHSLPGVRVYGRERSPTLVYYYDQDNDWANVSVDVTLAPATPTPDSVRTTLYDMTTGTPSTPPVAERTDAGGAGWARTGGSAWVSAGRGWVRVRAGSCRIG